MIHIAPMRLFLCAFCLIVAAASAEASSSAEPQTALPRLQYVPVDLTPAVTLLPAGASVPQPALPDVVTTPEQSRS